MTTRQGFGALLVLLGGVAAVRGQVPGAAPAVPVVPGAPALPGGPAAGAATGLGAGGVPAAAAPAAAPPKNIWSFFMMTPEQKLQHQQNSAICKAKFCATKIGQFVNNMLLPASAVTGGLLGPFCPGPNAANPADLQKPATSPQGAAARIKAEEAQVKDKIAAIEFLATVDCRYYPEAEAGMITGLRAEKNECVRLAAARALATGCCCTPKIIKALTISVNGSTEDKFPAERSELVRTFAYVALERCMQKCVEGEAEPPPEPPPAAKQAIYETLAPFAPTADYATAILMASYFAPAGLEPTERLHAKARLALGRGLHLSPQTIARLSGPKNVLDTVAPGFDPLRPAGFMDRPAPRPEATPAPWVKTLPRPTTAEPDRVRDPVLPAALPEPTRPARADAMPPADPEPRTGRGNLLNIFQSARRR